MFFDSVLGNNRTFYLQVALLIIIISGGRQEKNMEIINGKMKDNDFVMNSMEQMSKIFSISCQNNNSRKGDKEQTYFFPKNYVGGNY